MATVEFLAPADQPAGRRRLVGVLREELRNAAHDRASFVVAFAKIGPLLRLAGEFDSWRVPNRRIDAIIGIDRRGTSVQALEFALEAFSSVYVVHGGGFTTFHPKVYLFAGAQAALAVVGSHNLTVGGTETNYEAGVLVGMALPADGNLLRNIEASISMLATSPRTKRLDAELLSRLYRAGVLLDESAAGRHTQESAEQARVSEDVLQEIFGPAAHVPPSTQPARGLRRPGAPSRRGRVEPSPIRTDVADALVIEIVPHHNGEVFLSKKALDQRPAFFGHPFTGRTIPKSNRNRPYPQRVPDPVVSINVYGPDGRLAHRVQEFGLNMVEYTTKSEIRITFSQEWLAHVPVRAVMVMRLAEAGSGLDYVLDIYAPGSSEYDAFLDCCDQTLPSGGAALSRHMGWL